MKGIALWILGACVFTPFYFYVLYLFASKATVASVVVVVFIAFIPEIEIVRHWLRRPRKAEFYDDSMKVVGRGLDEVISYSQVKRYASSKSELAGDRLRIWLSDEKPLVFYSNPKNKELKTDLFSWIAGRFKTEQLTNA